MASPTSSSLRLTLRAGLFGGVLLDSIVALAILAAAWGLVFEAKPSAPAVSYPWLLAPALAGRAGIQAFACYDRRRYDQAIPWLASTLVLSGALAWLDGTPGPGVVAAYGLLGTLQWMAWRRTR